jgi:hypothetical protein
MLSAIFAAMPTTAENPSGQPRPIFPTQVWCNETKFLDFVDAQHVTFADMLILRKAKFEAGVRWNGSAFNAGLNMRGCEIYGKEASFPHVRVRGGAAWAGLVCQPFLNLFGMDVEEVFDMREAKCAGMWLSHARLGGEVKLAGARLAERFEAEGSPERKLLGRFDGCVFEKSADFSSTRFPYETTFGGYFDMPPAQFSGPVNFSGSQFGSETDGGRHLLRNLNFGSVDWGDSTFYGRVSFAGTTFKKPLRFVRVSVKAQVADTSEEPNPDDQFPEYPALELTDLSLPEGGELTRIAVQGDLTIKIRDFKGDFDTREVEATGQVSILGIQFSQYVTLELSGKSISYSRCQFTQGGVLTCSAERLSVVECDARQALTITAAPGPPPVPIGAFDRTNAEHILLSNVDLSTTTFAGIINLDKLRIQGPLLLKRAPTLTNRGRRIIQDEGNIRAGKSLLWRDFPTSTENNHPLSPQEVASLYRALRKNLEDAKDEPGAADFYYGEMEMRRLAASRTSVDRWLLTGYWLLSGYALRAWRALATLAGLLLLLSYFLYRYGFSPAARRDYVQSVLLLAQTSVGLARIPQELTPAGSTLQIVMRIAGPALLALAVFALRGRVKR